MSEEISMIWVKWGNKTQGKNVLGSGNSKWKGLEARVIRTARQPSVSGKSVK